MNQRQGMAGSGKKMVQSSSALYVLAARSCCAGSFDSELVTQPIESDVWESAAAVVAFAGALSTGTGVFLGKEEIAFESVARKKGGEKTRKESYRGSDCSVPGEKSADGETENDKRENGGADNGKCTPDAESTLDLEKD